MKEWKVQGKKKHGGKMAIKRFAEKFFSLTTPVRNDLLAYIHFRAVRGLNSVQPWVWDGKGRYEQPKLAS